MQAHAETPAGFAPFLAEFAAALTDADLDLTDLVTVATQTAPALALPLQISFWDGLARFCDRRAAAVYAVACQERALALLSADDDETQQRRSVLLFNHAGYLANAGHLDDAVAALEQVVAIDEALGLDDLESDRAALQRMRQRRDAGASADDSDLAAAIQQQLAQLSPAERAQVEAALAQAQQQLAQMSPEERAALQNRMAADAIEGQADQIVEAALAAQRDGRVDELLPALEAAADHFAADEEAGSPYDQLARFTRAVIALLRGDDPPPVPAAHVERMARLRGQNRT